MLHPKPLKIVLTNRFLQRWVLTLLLGLSMHMYPRQSLHYHPVLVTWTFLLHFITKPWL